MARQVSRLELTAIAKAFGSTRALDDVSLSVAPGRIHALLGENGAGKSTLMQVIAGAERPDRGSMSLEGLPYHPVSPGQARERGVAIVHQELSICPDLNVRENVLLGAEPTRLGLVDARRARQRTERALRLLRGADRPLDPDTPVSELSPAEQQLVEIARALAHEAPKLLILDEPTSSLGGDDVERLFASLRALRDEGLAIIYISHFLEEVRRLADDFTVLRDGRAVLSGEVQASGDDDWIAAMVGENVTHGAAPAERTAGQEALGCTGLVSASGLAGVDLSLARGEVLGIAGLVGSGRTELLRALFGLEPVSAGQVRVRGQRVVPSPAAQLARGIGLLSEDRKSEGLALALSVADNLTLSKLTPFGRWGVVSPRRQRGVAAAWVDRLRIRCRDVSQPARELSGGNQQKVAIARLLHHDVEVLLLDEPTRGVDVSSRAEVHALIADLAARGKAVLMVSSSISELLETCDRIAVMRRGVLGAPRPARELSEHGLLAEASGA